MTLITKEQLVSDIHDLGLETGSIVLAHISMSQIGNIIGGEQTVIEALLQALGTSGSLVMPSQSWQLCDPEYLGLPNDPPETWQRIRDHLPVYDPSLTPTRSMGVVAELFRTIPGALRSGHPHRSFAAFGPHAAEIVAMHDLDSPNGERSPLRTLVDLDAMTLLIGVGHDKSTILHLAEHRSGTLTRTIRNGAPLRIDGMRRWIAYDELEVHDHDFAGVGAAFAQETRLQRTGMIGNATAILVPQRPLVDYAARWFSTHRLPVESDQWDGMQPVRSVFAS